jgi:hypothetical protein
MIRYALRCDSRHEFEAWFRDSAAYDQQAARGILECPVCASSAISKAPMAPAIARAGRSVAAADPVVEATPAPVSAEPVPAPAQTMQTMPPQAAALRAMLMAVRKQIETNCDYVGDKFADEARRIHHGESDARGIYGEATRDEAEALADEGIDIAAIPWIQADS